MKTIMLILTVMSAANYWITVKNKKIKRNLRKSKKVLDLAHMKITGVETRTSKS